MTTEGILHTLIQGPTGSGKSTILLEKYRYMVEKLGIQSEKILILLLNRTQSLEWRTKTILNSSGTIWRTSYYGFIQSEIRAYYSIVLKNCHEIGIKRINPIFLTFESAQFLVSKVIQNLREKDGLFAGLTSFNDRIAIDLTSNLVKSAISDISFDEIGTRLFDALSQKDDIKKQIYFEADNILAAYRKKCMELGIFDFAIAVNLYNNYLFKDESYRKHLKKRVQHLIVDNIEECSPAEVDLIDHLLNNVKTSVISYNIEGGYGRSFGGNHEYVKEKIIDKHKFTSIELNKPHTCNEFMCEFSDMLFDKIKNNTNIPNGKYNYNKIMIERNSPVELRSEMLEQIGDRVLTLIQKEGYNPHDIIILSNYADPVSEFVIERIIQNNGISLKNLARNNRVIDNPFAHALITLTQLCHPSYGVIPLKDDVKALLRLVLKIDPIRSSLLANEICSQRPFANFPDIEFPRLVERIGYYNVEKYEYIRAWIKEYKLREKPMIINEFLQKIFLEILISNEVTQSDILQAKKLIDSAHSFVEVVSKFNRNASKDFVDMVTKGIKSAESIFELEEKLRGDSVLMCTPIVFLANSLKAKVIIISSLSSKNWTPRSSKELTNIHVLTKTWNKDDVYTDEIDEINQRKYLAIFMRSIIKKCSEKLITFESNLSSNGFENDGVLSQYLNDMYC